jgi:hypothetical protein
MGARTKTKFEKTEAQSKFEFYATPPRAVLPLIPFLGDVKTFAEPCVGNGDLVRHLEYWGPSCTSRGDISTGQDALKTGSFGDVDYIITNPPFSLKHAMILHFQRFLPTWLLLPLEAATTLEAPPFFEHCSHIVSVGKVKWKPGTRDKSDFSYAWAAVVLPVAGRLRLSGRRRGTNTKSQGEAGMTTRYDEWDQMDNIVCAMREAQGKMHRFESRKEWLRFNAELNETISRCSAALRDAHRAGTIDAERVRRLLDRWEGCRL